MLKESGRDDVKSSRPGKAGGSPPCGLLSYVLNSLHQVGILLK